MVAYGIRGTNGKAEKQKGRRVGNQILNSECSECSVGHLFLAHFGRIVPGVFGAGELTGFDDAALEDGDEAAAVFEDGDVF